MSSSGLALLRSRTASPSSSTPTAKSKSAGIDDSSVSSSSTEKHITQPVIISEHVSSPPEPRAFSPATMDMNRVHEELEKLNIATDVINKLELQLDQARETFREIQSSWTQKLEQLSKKLGACIEKSRPYYEARARLQEAQQDAQRAALRFERANSFRAVAKQQVALTQESLHRQQPGEVDPACLEVLNHHIQCVNEAERERLQSEEEHRRVSGRVEEANGRVCGLEKELKRSIQKSKPYFEARVEFNKVLDDQKALIQRLEGEIKQKKKDYNRSLRNLERISEEIHERRQSLGRRDPGVGSETPAPPPAARKDSADEREPEAVFVATKTAPHSSDTSTTESSRRDGLSPQTKASVVYLRRKSRSKSTKVDDIMEILGAKAAVLIEPEDSSSTTNGDRPRAESMPPNASGSARTRLNSGIILLAQQLLSSNTNGGLDRKTRAFTFPPEELDVRYKTIPEGVKPFPTPPETPSSPPPNFAVADPVLGGTLLTRPRSDTNLVTLSSSTKAADVGIHSDASSLCSFSLDDDHVVHAIRSPYHVMKEIDNVFDRIQNSAEQSEEDSGCSVRNSDPLVGIGGVSSPGPSECNSGSEH